MLHIHNFLVFCLILLNASHTHAQLSRGDQESQQTYFDDASQRKWNERPGVGNNLHVVLVIDTHARNAAALGIPNDGITFLRLLNTFFPSGKSGSHELKSIRLLAGGDVSKETIIKTIQEVRSNPDDTIMFYYSGHGGVDERVQKDLMANGITPDRTRRYDFDNGHILATSSGIINRTEVKKALAMRPAQLRILITDCCANFPSTRDASKALKSASSMQNAVAPDTISRNGKLEPFELRAKDIAVENLFFRSVGWVSINAAPPSQTTPGGKDGGIFTNGVVKELQQISTKLQNDNDRDSAFYQWSIIGHVPVKKRSQAEPLPNPGGVINGMEDPQFIYSYIFSDSTPIQAIGR